MNHKLIIDLLSVRLIAFVAKGVLHEFISLIASNYFPSTLAYVYDCVKVNGDVILLMKGFGTLCHVKDKRKIIDVFIRISYSVNT